MCLAPLAQMCDLCLVIILRLVVLQEKGKALCSNSRKDAELAEWQRARVEKELGECSFKPNIKKSQ